MKKSSITIKNSQLLPALGIQPPEFPRYTTQLMNLANQNSGGTRPRIVGQMSELIQQFAGQTLKEWET